MNKKSVFLLFGFAASVLLIVVSCMVPRHDSVSVVDASTRLPIAGASVLVVYPSFNSNTLITDERGVARIGGFGIASDTIEIDVTRQGYESTALYFKSPPPHRLQVVLKPSQK